MQFILGNTAKKCWGICLFAFIAIGGCNRGGTVQVSGSDSQAKQAVEKVLDAWKSGAKLTEFADANPEIVVADEDWQGGSVLSDYKLLESPTLNGSHWRQKTELKLKGKGKSNPVVAIYAVTLDKKTVILRSDFQY